MINEFKDSATNKLKCGECGETDSHYCSDEGEDGYFLRCACGWYPTCVSWTDSAGPYEEADKLLEASN